MSLDEFFIMSRISDKHTIPGELTQEAQFSMAMPQKTVYYHHYSQISLKPYY